MSDDENTTPIENEEINNDVVITSGIERRTLEDVMEDNFLRDTFQFHRVRFPRGTHQKVREDGHQYPK